MHQPRMYAGCATGHCRSRAACHARTQVADLYIHTPLVPLAGHYGATYGQFAYVSGWDLSQWLCSDDSNQWSQQPSF